MADFVIYSGPTGFYFALEFFPPAKRETLARERKRIKMSGEDEFIRSKGVDYCARAFHIEIAEVQKQLEKEMK